MPGFNAISKLKYDEAEAKIGSEIIQKNHKILNSAIENIEDSMLICEYPELEINPMRTQIFYLPPEFLEAPSDPKLLELNKNIELYISKYESLCQKLNDYIENNIDKKLKSLYGPSFNMKKEIKDIIIHFEETIKNLCGPLISEEEGLKSIDEDSFNNSLKKSLLKDKLQITENIKKFKKEAEELNQKYNIMFSDIGAAVEFIFNGIKSVPSFLSKLQDKIEEGMSKFEEILELFNNKEEGDKYYKYIERIHKSLEIIIEYKNKIVKGVEDDINNLEKQYKNRRDSFINLKDDVEKNIKSLETRAKEINNDILDVRKKYNQKKIELPEISISSISDIIIKKVRVILEENSNDSFKILKNTELDKKAIQRVFINVESFVNEAYLDLLIVLDITGSMEQYFIQVKTKLYDIIENLKNSLRDLQIYNINLGFIGYKDVEEMFKNEVVDIPFTIDIDEITKKIDEVKIGGGDDTAEDIAYAFELALNKNWSNNKAKFIVLIPDSPCHGEKYHDPDLMDNYKKGIKNRKDIEE